jgi:hypothetical protein
MYYVRKQNSNLREWLEDMSINDGRMKTTYHINQRSSSISDIGS